MHMTETLYIGTRTPVLPLAYWRILGEGKGQDGVTERALDFSEAILLFIIIYVSGVQWT